MNLNQFHEKYGPRALRAVAVKADLDPCFVYQCRAGIRGLSVESMARLVEASDFKLSLRGLIGAKLKIDNIDRYYGVGRRKEA